MKTFITIILFAVSTHAWSQQFTFVFLNKKPDAEKLTEEQSKKIMEGHMANIGRLASEGKLISAGPFEGGGGIFILNTTSPAEAEQWLSTDPGVQAKRWNVELLPYTPKIGSACKLSEPYEMVTYSLIRFNVASGKASPDKKVIKGHDEYIQQLASLGNVITAGVFNGEGAGILVMKGEYQLSVTDNDPAIQSGALQCHVKKLWIAKGAFCEK